jgi:hypothetical protein|eukprot:SAG25_NODE_558_length_6927_cov_5.344171_5_plen_84_part_00
MVIDMVLQSTEDAVTTRLWIVRFIARLRQRTTQYLFMRVYVLHTSIIYYSATATSAPSPLGNFVNVVAFGRRNPLGNACQNRR